MTSESRIRRHTISLPLSERRSTPRLRWLRPLRRKKTLTPFKYASAPDQWRSQAPLGGSIFTTSAPRSARIWTADGPCRKCVKLRTFTPSNIVYPVLSGKSWRANPLYLDLIATLGSPLETRPALLEEGQDPLGTVLDVSPECGVGLCPERAWRQPGLGNDATHPLPLRVGDAAQRGTHVGLVDPAQDGQRLLHPVVPGEERLSVSRLHHRVDLVRHPAGSLQVAAVYSVKHLHLQIGYDAAVPGEDA